MRIATFNIKHGALTQEYHSNPEQVMAAFQELAAFEPDILALQEADQGVLRSGRANLAEIAAEACDMNFRFAKTRRQSTGKYGNALLVRGDIQDFRVVDLGGGKRFKLKLGEHKLPPFGYEPRNALLATAVIGERKISVATTHLSTEKHIQGKQLTRLVGALACQPEPMALLGDLNMNLHQVQKSRASGVLEFAKAMPTFPADNPRRQIDHIAVSGLSIVEAQTVRLPISDHLALIVDVE